MIEKSVTLDRFPAVSGKTESGEVEQVRGKTPSGRVCCAGGCSATPGGGRGNRVSHANLEGTIPSGWYEAIIEEARPGRHGIRSGMDLDMSLPRAAQGIRYYIPAGSAGYFARKNFCYFADYPYHSKGRYDERRLAGRYIRVYVESREKNGKGFVVIRAFAFSERQLFASCCDKDTPSDGDKMGRPAA